MSILFACFLLGRAAVDEFNTANSVASRIKKAAGGDNATRILEEKVPETAGGRERVRKATTAAATPVNRDGKVENNVIISARGSSVRKVDRTAASPTSKDEGEGRPSSGGKQERKNYTSPVESLFRDHDFPNDAVERELRRHDRFVVESLAYIARFDDRSTAKFVDAETKFRASSSSAGAAGRGAGVGGGSGNGNGGKPIALVVLTAHRDVPYLAVLVSMLLRGHDPAVFAESMDVHIVNVERRPGRRDYYPLFEDLRRKIGTFVHFHDWTAIYPQHSDLGDRTYRADQRIDYVRAMRLCQSESSSEVEGSPSRWCVLMEDDAVPAVDFATKFRRYVDRDIFPNATESGTDDVALEDVFLLRLYTPFAPFQWRKVKEPPTTAGRRQGQQGAAGQNVILANQGERYKPTHKEMIYNANRALDYNEAQYRGVLPAEKKIAYKVKYNPERYGTVAIAYPTITLNRTIAYLERTDSRKGITSDISLGFDADPFLREENLNRLGTVPSLVNHLGIYSDHSGGDWGRGVSTDIRFKLDDGPSEADS